MSQDQIQETLLGRDKRERYSIVPIGARTLPLLGVVLLDLLRVWAKSDSTTRSWLPLLGLAGPCQIEASEQLAEQLLQCGWLSIKERREKGAWQRQSITWMDLPELKVLLGISSKADRQSQREALLSDLRDWSQTHPVLESAVQALHEAKTMKLDDLAQRISLLQSLMQWQLEQRIGTRRDFALEAGDGTKALTSSMWSWLDEYVDLPALGINRFMPQIWLAGPLQLTWSDKPTCDLSALHCVGLSAQDMVKLTQVKAPSQYWLIENRASFERQAAQCSGDVALIWLPGRPPNSWMTAISALLDLAPRPALISADPDPAGVEIALTASTIWQSRALPWQAHLMGAETLQVARKVSPLGAGYDRAVLTRLLQRTDLPVVLKDLCDYMRIHGVKAEQEGWL
ncbi:MAG: hypothetical protein KGL57_05670 [Burkholderiales bacterium]|nr:hypothetical protein [Burkholderiales bacterium]